MANLEITDFCNMKCKYCFAAEHMSQPHSGDASRYISLDTFERHLDFLDRSEIDQIRLIGGEPTLHPKFSQLIDLSQSRRKKIIVFSNGIMPEKALRRLEQLPVESCTVLINMSASDDRGMLPNKERDIQRQTILTLGRRIALGYNIYRADFDIEAFYPLINAADTSKEIRLGLAHPTLTGQNRYLKQKQYPIVGRKIVQAAKAAAEFEIRLSFDCGFVHCMFSEKDIEFLQEINMDIGWRCNPVLDITMGGDVLHCYPLAGKVSLQMSGAENAASLRRQFIEDLAFLQPFGIYPECSICQYKMSGECTGGCLGSRMQRLRKPSFKIVLPEVLVLKE